MTGENRNSIVTAVVHRGKEPRGDDELRLVGEPVFRRCHFLPPTETFARKPHYLRKHVVL